MKCDNCNHQKDGACGNHHSPYSGLKTDFDWGCAFFAPRPDVSQVVVTFSENENGITASFETRLGSNEFLNDGAKTVVQWIRNSWTRFECKKEGEA